MKLTGLVYYLTLVPVTVVVVIAALFIAWMGRQTFIHN